MEKDEDPTTADDIPLDEVPDELQDRVRQMLRRHEHMWHGKLGEINVTEHGIDLKPGSKPFKSPPFRAGPKTRELVQFEVDKQLKAGGHRTIYIRMGGTRLIRPKEGWKAPLLR